MNRHMINSVNLAGLVWIIGLAASATAVAQDVQPTEMKYPYAVASDGAKNIFVVDRDLPGVWKLSDGKLSLYHQASNKFRTPLNVPRCIAVDKKGQPLVGCSPTRDVYRVGEKGDPKGLTGGGSYGIGIPMGIGVNKAGDLLVSDLEQHCIWKVKSAGGKPELFAKVAAPRGIFVDEKDQVWVVTTLKDPIKRISPDGKSETIVEGRPFKFPSNIVVDSEATAYVCDSYAKAIWKIPAGGRPEKLAEGEPMQHPVGLCWHGKKLLVADPHAKTIFEIFLDGTVKKLN